jgi:hypothetical protein
MKPPGMSAVPRMASHWIPADSARGGVRLRILLALNIVMSVMQAADRIESTGPL